MVSLFRPMKEPRIQLLRGRLESLKNDLILLFHVLQLANSQAKGFEYHLHFQRFILMVVIGNWKRVHSKKSARRSANCISDNKTHLKPCNLWRVN